MSNELKLVNTTLEKKNFFDENSKMILESATELENIIITVEKSFNNIQIDFKYDSTKSKFVMVNVYEEKSVQQYYKCYICPLQCFKTEMTVDEFLALVSNSLFKPIAIKLA